jgi:hypothetical protein
MARWNPFKKEEPVADDKNQSKSEADLLVEKLGPMIEAAVKPIRDEFTNFKHTLLSSVEEEDRKTREAAARTAEGELTDAEKLANQNKALFAQNVLTNARITENEVASSIEREYPHLLPEFRQMCVNTSIETKANVNYRSMCENAINQMVGRDARKNGLRYDRNSSKFMIEDATAKTGGADSPLADPDLTWTDPHTGKTLTAGEQLAKLNIDPKSFADSMKRGVV